MVKCPCCGSSAQPKVVATKYIEDGWTIEVVRTYKCGCGQTFTGTSYYTCQECYEIVEKIEKGGLTKPPNHVIIQIQTKERGNKNEYYQDVLDDADWPIPHEGF